MRILYYHRTLGDGAEGIHIGQMVSAFRGLGHDVFVSGLAVEGGRRAGRLSRIKGLLPASAFELAAAGCNVLEYRDVAQQISRIGAGLVYKRHARNDCAAAAAARAAGVPVVLEVNCLFSGQSYQQFEPVAFGALTQRLEYRALRAATWIVAVSSPLGAQIGELGFGNVVVIPNGADPATFDPSTSDENEVRSRYGLGEDLVVGWTGILREWHGLELLIDAVAAVPRGRLLIVGDGPARAALERRISAHGLNRRVTLAGRVPHAAMPSYIAAMDIAVVAEEGTRIASPMKLLEYMAMSRAVVAPALENIRDVIEDQVNGLLFAPGDSAALADTLARLSSDASLRQRLGESARQSIVLERNWTRNAERVLALLETAPAPFPESARPLGDLAAGAEPGTRVVR